MEGAKSPVVGRIVTSFIAATSTRPGYHASAITEEILRLIRHDSIEVYAFWSRLGCDLPRPIQIPEVHAVKVCVSIELIFMAGTRFAETVTSEACVNVDITHLYKKLRADYIFVYVIDSRDPVSERRSRFSLTKCLRVSRERSIF